jgi:hypothetical protein
MNSNLNSNVKSKIVAKQIVCTGMHPEGGFVALPGGRTSRIMHDQNGVKARNINRKGFVAWPIKD